MVPTIARLPVVAVDVDGQRLDTTQAAGLVEVVVRRALGAPALCELVFAEPPGSRDVGAVLRPGASLIVSLIGSSVRLFDGDIVGVEYAFGPMHERELRVRGYDALHLLRKRQTVRVFEQMSALDLARELGSAVGLDVDGAEGGPTWDRIVQHRQTDLGLLLEVGAANGLYLTVQDGSLRLVTLDGSGEPIPLRWGSTLLEAVVDASAEPAVNSVEVSGWDPSRAEAWKASASEPRSGRDVALQIDSTEFGGSAQRFLVDEAAPAADRATALAQAELDTRTASEVVLTGTTLGDARLMPAAIVDVENLGPDLSGRYVLTETTHRISRAQGYLTEISTRPPVVAPRRQETIAVPGVVSNVDDPDSLARVRVTFPTFSDIESAWMEVVTTGAGSGKGLVALPDVGDDVLVLLFHGDPANGVVLGGLYGANGAPDSGVVSGAVKRYTLVTSGGQRVKFDDENKELVFEDASGGSVTLAEKRIKVEDATGSSLEMSQDSVVLHSAVSLRIEAPGNSVVVRGSSIDFETA